MKKITLIIASILALALFVTGCSAKPAEEASSGEAAKATAAAPAEEKTYQYYTADQTKSAIENNEDVILLDIQVEDEWAAHHIKGAIPTHAYPVKTDEEKAKLDAVVSKLEGTQPIIVICPGGKGGATRTIDYLTESKGIAAERLFILENGQGGWPYDELLEK